jgi:hypothetical protein
MEREMIRTKAREDNLLKRCLDAKTLDNLFCCTSEAEANFFGLEHQSVGREFDDGQVKLLGVDRGGARSGHRGAHAV